MAYTNIPTLPEWLKDTKKPDLGSGLFQIICNFISEYHAAKEKGSSAGKKLYVVYLYYATKYWKKKAGSQFKTGPDAGATRLPLDPSSVTPVTDLNDLCVKKIRLKYDIEPDADLDRELVTMFGRMNPFQEADLAAVKKGQVWLETDGARSRYKARIRGGIVYRSVDLKRQDDAPTQYAPYDSATSGESEKKDGFVHYAMDRRGRLYIGYDDRAGKFVHSSLTGGETVISAGTIEVKKGQIAEITNDSGHYQPFAKNLRDMLVQLQIRGVNLGPVMVKHYKTGEKMTAKQLFEKGNWQHSS